MLPQTPEKDSICLSEIFYDKDFLEAFIDFVGFNYKIIESYKLPDDLKDFFSFFKELNLEEDGSIEKIKEEYTKERLIKNFSFIFSCKKALAHFISYVQGLKKSGKFFENFDLDNFVLLLDRIIDRKSRVLIIKNGPEDETFRKRVSDLLEKKYDCTNSLLCLYQKGFQIYHDYFRVDFDDDFVIEGNLYVKIFSSSLGECYKNKNGETFVCNKKIVKKKIFLRKKVGKNFFNKYELFDGSIGYEVYLENYTSKNINRIDTKIIKNGEVDFIVLVFHLDNNEKIYLDSNLDEIHYEDIVHLLIGDSEEEDNPGISKLLDESIINKYIDLVFSFIDSEIKELFGIKFIYGIINSLKDGENIKVLLAENGEFVKIDGEFVYDIEPINYLGVVCLNQENSGFNKSKVYQINGKKVIEESRLKKILQNYKLER